MIVAAYAAFATLFFDAAVDAISLFADTPFPTLMLMRCYDAGYCYAMMISFRLSFFCYAYAIRFRHALPCMILRRHSIHTYAAAYFDITPRLIVIVAVAVTDA